jgi:hypothetical protein
MKRVALVLLVLALGAAGVFAAFRATASRLEAEHRARLTAEQTTPVTRSPPVRSALHDNGWRCLDAMLKVSPRDFGAFAASKEAGLTPYLTGAQPLPEELQEQLGTLTSWMNGLRDCGNSAALVANADLFMWGGAGDARRLQLRPAIESLGLHAAVELRLLSGRGDVEPTLEKCSQTLALAADLTHLGIEGNALATPLVARLLPVCLETLAKTVPATRTVVSTQWAAIPTRVATAEQVTSFERARLAQEKFAPQPVTLSSTLAWRSWDAGFAASAELTEALAAREATAELLTFALSLALKDATPRPHVKREGAQVTWEGRGGPFTVTAP